MFHVFYIIFYFCFALHLLETTILWYEDIQKTVKDQQACEYALAYCAHQLSFENNLEDAIKHLFPQLSLQLVQKKKRKFLKKYSLKDCQTFSCMGFQASTRQKKQRHFTHDWPLWSPGLIKILRTL